MVLVLHSWTKGNQSSQNTLNVYRTYEKLR
jgi:hypothetical protein